MKSNIYLLIVILSLSFCKHPRNKDNNTPLTNLSNMRVTEDLEEFNKCTSKMEKPELMAVNVIPGSRMSDSMKRKETAFTQKLLAKIPDTVEKFVRFDGKIVFVDREIDYCGIERDQTEDALGCLILVPRPVLYVAEIALENNIDASVEVFTRILRTRLNISQNIAYLRYQSTLCNETDQQFLNLTAKGISKLLKRADDPITSAPNIPPKKSSDFLMKMIKTMGPGGNFKLESANPQDVGKHLIESIRKDGADVDIGTFSIKDAAEVGHSWLAFVDWPKIRAAGDKLEVDVNSKNLHLDLINKYKNKDLDDALDEKLRAGPREDQPVAKFVSGTYGSGKSVTIKEYVQGRGDIPIIGADVFKAHLRELGGVSNATSTSLHVASSTLARNARKRLQNDGRSYIFEGSNISRSVMDAINSGLKADVSIRVIPTELSALRVLKRRVGGDDPNIPFDIIASNGSTQGALLDQLAVLKQANGNRLDLEIIIPSRDGSSSLIAESNGFQATTSFKIQDGNLPADILTEKGFTVPRDGFEQQSLRSIFDDSTVVSKSESESIIRSLEIEWGPRDSWLDLSLEKALNHKSQGLKTPPQAS